MTDPAVSRTHWEQAARHLWKEMRIVSIIAIQGRRGASPVARLMILALLLPLMWIQWVSCKALVPFTVDDTTH